MPEPIPTPREAPLHETPAGRVPSGPGWFVLSAREGAPWETLSGYGRSVRFEDREHEFPEFGLNIHRLEPGAAHVLIGADDGPCVVVMVGAGRPEGGLFYPVEEKAVSARAGVTKPTSDPRDAYSDIPDSALAACGEDWLPG